MLSCQEQLFEDFEQTERCELLVNFVQEDLSLVKNSLEHCALFESGLVFIPTPQRLKIIPAVVLLIRL